MAQIKKTPLSFWMHVIKQSFITIFDSEETRGSILKSIVSWTISVIAGFGVIVTLGWLGWLKGIGNNALTYLVTFISSLVLRFVTNLIITPSNLYFEARRDADKLNWGDVKSSVWQEPQEKSIIVGVKLERDESHSVQYLRAILRSVVKDGQIWFKGDGETLLPIRKDGGVIAWMKSFNHEKPRNFLVASVSGENFQIRAKQGETERTLDFKAGTYDITIGFTSEGGVNGHLFKGLLVFDGKSLNLKKIKV